MNTLYSNTARRDMLDGLLHWLSGQMENFRTPREDRLKDTEPESIQPDLSRKAFIELGLALRLATRSAFLREHPLLHRISDNWLAIQDESRFFFDIRRRLRLQPHRFVAYAVLQALGKEREELRADLQNVLDRAYLDRVERSAWDKTDMKYYIEAGGFSHQFESDASLYAHCSLRSLPAMPYVQNMDLYGLTHLLFHFADFGRKDIRALLGVDHPAVQQYVDLSLAMCTVKQDWDLVAELLISQYCLQKPFGMADRDSAAWLHAVQQPSGFIPGRDWITASHSAAQAMPAVEFADVYHPTIVSLILLCCEYE